MRNKISLILSLILLVNVDSAFAQQSNGENDTTVSLPKNDLWDLLIPGIYFKQSIAFTENNQNLYHSCLTWGPNNWVSFTFKVITIQNQNISDKSYLPLLSLLVRPYSFLEFKMDYEKPEFTLVVPNGATNSMQSNEEIDIKAGPQWFYRLRMEIPEKRGSNQVVLTDLMYHFPEDLIYYYLGRNSFFLNTNFTPYSENVVTTRFTYDILNGTDKFTLILPSTQNSFQKTYLSFVAALQIGFAVSGEIQQTQYEQKGERPSAQNNFNTQMKYSLGNMRVGLINTMIEKSFIMLSFNRFEIKLKELAAASDYDLNTFTTNEIGISTINVFNETSHALAEIKNNRDDYFGAFPYRNERVIETNIVYSTQEKLLQIFAELKYGIYSNLYVRFGVISNNMIDNSLNNQPSYFTYGLGFRNYSAQDENLPARTDRSDLFGRMLPVGKIHFEIRSLRDINDIEKIGRRHQFDASIGLPWGLNLHLQRKLTDYWSKTELMRNFPYILDFSPYRTYYSWAPVQYTNQVELKMFIIPELLGSVQFIYDETNYLEPNKFIKGHEVFGDNRLVFSLAVYVH